MSHLLFLAANAGEVPMTEDCPLLVDSLRSVSAAHIRLGAARDEFIRAESWVLSGQDDCEDMASTLCSWAFYEPQAPIILGFDGLYLIRRIATYCAKRGVKFVPAIYWCGAQSRCFDLLKYLSAGEHMEVVDLLKFLKIDCLPNYLPGVDARLDLKYAIEIADRYNIINEKLDSNVVGAVELAPMNVIEKATKETTPRAGKQKTAKQLKQPVIA